MRLAKRCSVVTGAGGAIGGAIAVGFAREGAAVVCIDIISEAAEAVASSIRAAGGSAWGLQCDATDIDDVGDATSRSIDLMGTVDILMMTVGGSGELIPILEMEPEAWDRVVNQNLRSVYLASRSFGAHMARQERGSIIATASQLGLVGLPGLADYCAAKAAVIHLVKVLALELAEKNVRVNTIAPGPTVTPETKGILEGNEGAGELKSSLFANLAFGRGARPEEMVGAAVYLASDEASFVTGTTLLVDGGFVLR